MIQKNKLSFVVVVVALLIAGTAPTVAAAGETPDPCHYTAYSADYEQRHFSLLKNNSTLIGQSFIIEQPGNCSLDIQLDGGVTFTFLGNNSLELPLHLDSILIIQNNRTHTFSSLKVYPSGSILYGDQIDNSILSQKTNDEVWWGEILAHGVTFVLLYILSTTIVYQIARKKVDNSIEVII